VTFRYQGNELALFAEAKQWKRYYAEVLRPFIGPSVLEVGAGIGGTTQLLCSGGSRRWLCLEPDEVLAAELYKDIQSGRLPASCEARIGTLSSLPEEERFNTICYIDVLEHIACDREEVERSISHLHPGGHLIVLAPAYQWLFSEFDASVGHFRRYSRSSLLSLTPARARVAAVRYLDSVGLLASLANRFVLRSAIPSPAQIRMWDTYMVPCSRLLDAVLRYRAGKSVVVVWQRS
jgi:2-polyprenyl-3-methyl-5-hydroxy-6-metoxy-1,4-benzoquinol methylase